MVLKHIDHSNLNEHNVRIVLKNNYRIYEK